MVITNQTTETDYRCVVTCTNSGLSDTTNVVSVGQNTPSQCYCTPTGGNGSSAYFIKKLSSSNAWYNFTYEATTYSAYTDNYATTQFLQVPGASVNVKFETFNTSTHYYYCWVDWNNDGDFSDAGETIFATTSYQATPYTGVIPIPAGQAPGDYRVRFALSGVGAITACGPAASGNYVDVKLTIGIPTSCTAAPTSVTITPEGNFGIVSVCEGSIVQFNSIIPPSFDNNFIYQWYQDGSPIAGATNTSYSTFATQPANYYVEIACASDPLAPIQSNTVQVDLSGPCPTICAPTGGTSSTTYYMNKISTLNGATNLLYTASSYVAYNNNFTTHSFSQFAGMNVNVKIESSSTSSNYYYCWVDWNNDGDFADAGETIFATTSYAVAPYNGIISIPLNQMPGDYRVRFGMSQLGAITGCGPAPYGNYVDAKLIVAEQTPCSLPIQLTGTSAPDSIMLSWNWTQNIHPIQSFNIQYGYEGFQLNSGSSTIVPANGTNNLDTVVNSNLLASGVYHVYVQAVCASGITSDYSGPITVIMPATNDLVCEAETIQSGTSYVFNNATATVSTGENTIAPPATGSQTTTGWVNSTLNGTLWYKFIAPTSGNVRIDATAITYNGQAAVYSASNCSDFSTFTLVAANDDAIGGTSTSPNFTICGLTPGNSYYIMFDKFNATSGNFSLLLSDIELEAGTANPLTNICTGEIVDLNSTIVTANTSGTWSSSIPAVNVSINGSNLNTNGIAYQTYTLKYEVVDGCAIDSVLTQVKIFPPSNAGLDGTINACKNEPINLLEGLGGSADLNGTWYNSTNTALPDGSIITPNFAGQYNYKYIVSNNVCPADTAIVQVTVGSCNWLDISEEVLGDVQVYPNPSHGTVYIESSLSSGELKLVVTDINGRLVQEVQNTIPGGTSVIDLKQVDRGTYFFRLYTENAAKVFRVVIQ